MKKLILSAALAVSILAVSTVPSYALNAVTALQIESRAAVGAGAIAAEAIESPELPMNYRDMYDIYFSNRDYMRDLTAWIEKEIPKMDKNQIHGYMRIIDQVNHIEFIPYWPGGKLQTLRALNDRIVDIISQWDGFYADYFHPNT